LRGIVGRSGCADDNHDNEHRSGNGHNNNSADDHQFRRKYRHLYPRLGLLHVPNDVSGGTRTLLLHKGHDGT